MNLNPFSLVKKAINFIKDDIEQSRINAEREAIATRQNLELELKNNMRSLINAESISCRCKGVAIPVFDSNNKYTCLKCGNKFANSHHKLKARVAYDLSRLRPSYK